MTQAIGGPGQAAALAALTKAGHVAVEPVQPVTGDKPAAERGFDASAGRTRSGGIAAMLLQWGGTPAGADQAQPEAATSKPNLDALNRVLAHYVAQSEAAARLGR